MKCIISIIIALTFVQSLPFQKIVWVYWHEQIQKSPFFVQLCVQKIRQTCKNQNFQVNVLTKNILKNYINDYDHFLYVLSRSERGGDSNQAFGDLLRIFLIQEHGGIYMDISVILFNEYGFKWLDNLNEYSHLIMNKNNQQPDVLMFTFGYYQSNVVQWDQNGQQVSQYPGFQVWFIAAKKKATLMVEYKKLYINFTLWGFSNYNQILAKQDILIRSSDIGKSFWSTLIVLSYIFQKTQIELDSNRSILDFFSARITSYQHYKVWAIRGEHGPLAFTRTQDVKQKDFFQQTAQQLEERIGKLRFFTKVNGDNRRILNSFLDYIMKTKINEKINFSKFMEMKPTLQDCGQVNFITYGSIIHRQLINNSKIGQNLKQAVISVKQRSALENYCKGLQYTPKYSKFTLQQIIIQSTIWQKFFVSRGSFNRAEYIDSLNLDLSIVQKIKSYIKGNMFIIRSLVYCLVEYIFVIIVSTLVLLIIKITLQYLFRLKIFGPISNSEDGLIKNEALSQSSFIKIVNKHKNSKFFVWTIIIIRILQVPIGRVLFYGVEIFNFIPLIFENMAYLITIILVERFIKKVKRNGLPGKTDFFLNQIQDFTAIPINYFLAYGVLSIIEKRVELWISHSILFGMIGPCLLAVSKKLQQKDQNINFALKYYNLRSNYPRYFILGFLVIINFIKKLQFLVFNQKKVLLNCLYLAQIYILILLFALIAEFFIQVYKRLKGLSQLYSYRQLIRIFLLIGILCSFTILSTQVHQKILDIATWSKKIYHLTIVCAFIYVYKLCCLGFENNRINISIFFLAIQLIVSYSLVFSYLKTGTFYFNYQLVYHYQCHRYGQPFYFLFNLLLLIALKLVLKNQKDSSALKAVQQFEFEQYQNQ